MSEYRYKTYTNNLTSILRLDEKAYYSKMLLETRGNIKETWEILNTANYPTHLMQNDQYSHQQQTMYG